MLSVTIRILLPTALLLIIIVRQHIRPHVDSIFQAIKDFSSVAKLQITLVSVIEAISKALEGEFKRLVPLTLTLFLVILENDKSSDKVLPEGY